MGRQVDRHRTLAAELIRQAEQAQAEQRHQDAADARTAAAEHDAQADATATAQQARTWWEPTTNPSGKPHATHAPNSAAAASAPNPNPASPTPRPPRKPSPPPRTKPAASPHGGSSSIPLDPDASHVDPAWHAQIKAEQTASIQAGRDEASAWWQQFETAAQTTDAALATERENAIAGRRAHRTGTRHARAFRCGRPGTAEAGHETTLEWWQQLDTPDPDAGHVDPAWHAQIKAEQTARVQADKAARREASARAYPVTDTEIARYGAHHALAAEAEHEPLLTAPTEHDDPAAAETPGQYHARMQSYAQWQPENHPEANVEPAREGQADTPDHGEIEP